MRRADRGWWHACRGRVLVCSRLLFPRHNIGVAAWRCGNHVVGCTPGVGGGAHRSTVAMASSPGERVGPLGHRGWQHPAWIRAPGPARSEASAAPGMPPDGAKKSVNQGRTWRSPDNEQNIALPPAAPHRCKFRPWQTHLGRWRSGDGWLDAQRCKSAVKWCRSQRARMSRGE